jgi:hypothetical protein
MLIDGTNTKNINNYTTARNTVNANRNRFSKGNYRTPQDRANSTVEKDSYWKERVDLLIYEKKKWIKERKEFH